MVVAPGTLHGLVPKTISGWFFSTWQVSSSYSSFNLIAIGFIPYGKLASFVLLLKLPINQNCISASFHILLSQCLLQWNHIQPFWILILLSFVHQKHSQKERLSKAEFGFLTSSLNSRHLSRCIIFWGFGCFTSLPSMAPFLSSAASLDWTFLGFSLSKKTLHLERFWSFWKALTAICLILQTLRIQTHSYNKDWSHAQSMILCVIPSLGRIVYKVKVASWA